MIPRTITDTIRDAVSQFPFVTLTGARQSGKTTLLREEFPDYRYVSLESSRAQKLAAEDPEAFLGLYDDRVIFDEVQRVPNLFSDVQVLVDERRQRPGQFIFSGSQNFLLLKSISQSLAGRAAILHLLPLSYQELRQGGVAPESMDQWVFQGGYPRLFDRDVEHKVSRNLYFSGYADTYIERDVRAELGVRKIGDFTKFLQQCALRCGEMLNYNALAVACGVSVGTVKEWLSLLESSFIVFRLYPYHTNFGKRLVKTPKLYFYDTGLAAYLAGLDSLEAFVLSDHRGSLFENAVIVELMKLYFAQGRKPQLYFWRDAKRKEIDLLIEKGGKVRYAVEIKASAVFDSHAFAVVDELGDQFGLDTQHRVVVYGGDQTVDTRFGKLLQVADLPNLVV
ncbi:ATP-binding protein [Bifidobacterium sp. ESL0732]|uniref:ATP-binding protein n=1 Tax=Bifidobacterium sp. ESL0732 TaxID=2983222 RepID=UPI0023F7200C|nr:ATP-binding protein [Bifidobacterium sp. ESL0732]WEV63924.1 ATP-binding protein [Bifidobacterium sp. ESL0732]